MSLRRKFLLSSACLLAAIGFSSCGSVKDNRNKMVVSVRDQKMVLVKDGKTVKSYRISTSKFGIGDRPGSNCTPLGRMQVVKKIGGNAPVGGVFKSRRFTGEVLRPNAPGRDPIVSRILWLNGTEACNKNSFRRFIYIHGTPEERRLGTPASYGCIRMGGKDVVDLYNRIGTGAEVVVVRGSLEETRRTQPVAFNNSTLGNGGM
jgi:hypothetical protein